MTDGTSNRSNAILALRRKERASALEALRIAADRHDAAGRMLDQLRADITELRETLNRSADKGSRRAAELIAASTKRSLLFARLKTAEQKERELETLVAETASALAAAQDLVARAQRTLVAMKDKIKPPGTP